MKGSGESKGSLDLPLSKFSEWRRQGMAIL